MNTETSTESIGQRLSRARKKAGFTQKELAAALNVSQQMITFWERKAKFPAPEYLPEISNLLNISVDELIGFQPPAKRGPVSRLEKTLVTISELPKRQQDRILDVIDALIKTA